MAGIVKYELLIVSIPNPLRDPAMNLAVDDHGIDYGPAVMHDDISLYLNHHCIRVDLDDHGVSTARRRTALADRNSGLLPILAQTPAPRRREGDWPFGQARQSPWRASERQLSKPVPSADLQIGFGAFEFLGREAQNFFPNRCCRSMDRGARQQPHHGSQMYRSPSRTGLYPR